MIQKRKLQQNSNPSKKSPRVDKDDAKQITNSGAESHYRLQQLESHILNFLRLQYDSQRNDTDTANNDKILRAIKPIKNGSSKKMFSSAVSLTFLLEKEDVMILDNDMGSNAFFTSVSFLSSFLEEKN